MITAKIVADSTTQADVRITTLELTYPRFIHAEFMTHRVFSRNAASSRAIPVGKLLAAVVQEPVVPIQWGKNKAGMQAQTELTGWKRKAAQFLWHSHRWSSLGHVWVLMKLGLHKQLANRLLEPHSHIKVLVTSTLWENFFHLRDHEHAQPEIHELAWRILVAMDESTPILLQEGEWHLPYITQSDWDDRFTKEAGIAADHKMRLVSAARCARVSYTVFDRRHTSVPEDFKLGYKLVNGEPLHASPLEHQASPDPFNHNKHLWGNFHGWIQHRKTYATEARMEDSHSLAHNRIVPLHAGSR